MRIRTEPLFQGADPGRLSLGELQVDRGKIDLPKVWSGFDNLSSQFVCIVTPVLLAPSIDLRDYDRTHPTYCSDNNTPPPKLSLCGSGPPLVTFTAQYLNSGILPKGSSTGLVSVLAAAS